MSYLLEIAERAQTGPIVLKDEYDLKLLPEKVVETAKKYEITPKSYDEENPVQQDEDLADEVFRAGMDLLIDLGYYCADTQRLIKFEEDEIKNVLRSAPSRITLGEGKDRVTIESRTVGDSKVPIILGGPAGQPISEDIYVKVHQSYAMEPTISGLITGCLPTIFGKQITVGTPSEICGSMYTVLWAKEAVRLAGRPGMHIIIDGTPMTPAAKLALFFPGGLKGTDGLILANEFECKTSWLNLMTSLYTSMSGYVNFVGAIPNLYAYIGRPEQAAIVGVAEFIGTLATLDCDVVTTGCYDIDMHKTRREELWVSSTIILALKRNSRVIVSRIPGVTAGPCTDMALYEAAALMAMSVPCGVDHNIGPSALKGQLKDYCTPMEIKMAGEVAKAVAGMGREEANHLVNKLLERYEERTKNPPKGKSFRECYNLKTLTPSREYVKIYGRVKRELEDMGLAFKQPKEV